MIKLFRCLIAALLISAPVCAQTALAPISGLPSAGNLSTGDTTILVRSGVTYKGIVSLFGSSNAGFVPASGGGTTNYLRADGTWSAPSGGGGGGSLQLSGVVTTPSSSSGVTSFGTFPSSSLSAAISDETGSGSAVFANSPTLSGTVNGAAATWSGVDTALNFSATGTGANTAPVGTTGQRPTGANGMLRYNSTLTAFEGYVNGAWQSLLSIQNGILGVTQGGTGYSIVTEVGRSPNATDDTSRVYSVGQFWKDADNNIWQNAVNTAGSAIWNFIGAVQSYACDAIPCYTAYGAYQLVRDYTGPAFAVYNGSTTTPIPFVNGTADFALMDSLTAAGSTCTIPTVYNQTVTGAGSGHTHDCISSSAAAAMPCPTRSVFGLRGLNMNGNYRIQQNSAIGAECTDANASFSSQAMSMFYIGREQQVGNVQMQAQLGGTSAYAMRWFITNGGDNFVTTGGTFYPTGSPGTHTTAPNVWGFTSGTTTQAVYTDDIGISSTSNFTAATWTNLTIGSDPSSESSHYFAATDWFGFVTSQSAVSSTQVAALRKVAYSRFPIIPQIRLGVPFIGDSLTAGWGDSVGATFPDQFQSMITRRYKIANEAVGGTTCQSLSVSSQPATAITGVVSIFAYTDCGTNDIFSGTSPAATYAYLQTLLANERTAAGANVPLLVATMIDRGNGAQEANRQSYNTLIRNGISNGTIVSGPVYLVDQGAAAPLGVSGNSTNTTCFQTDQIHLTDYCNNVKAANLKKVVDANGLLK